MLAPPGRRSARRRQICRRTFFIEAGGAAKPQSCLAADTLRQSARRGLIGPEDGFISHRVLTPSICRRWRSSAVSAGAAGATGCTCIAFKGARWIPRAIRLPGSATKSARLPGWPQEELQNLAEHSQQGIALWACMLYICPSEHTDSIRACPGVSHPCTAAHAHPLHLQPVQAASEQHKVTAHLNAHANWSSPQQRAGQALPAATACGCLCLQLAAERRGRACCPSGPHSAPV